ncbi:MAG: hypothetical protein RLZZ444_3138, partial [Pseudomonadota bacterium]
MVNDTIIPAKQGICTMTVSHFGTTWISNSDSDTITGTDEKEFIYGNAGNDTLKGMGGHDSIQGGLGNDVIQGGDGDDILVDLGSLEGATGNELLGKDKLYGGKGND